MRERRIMKRSVVGNGYLQWNAGGWFGGVIGSSAWMPVVAGFLIAGRQTSVAIIPTLCFVAAVALACLLWRKRDHVQPFNALMVMLLLLSVTIPVTWISTSLNASKENLIAMNWPESRGLLICTFLISPMTMLYFFFLERFHPSRLTHRQSL